MSKQTLFQKYNEVLECNGLDKNYQILHMLNSKSIIVQLVEEDSGATFPETEYKCIRDTENTMYIKFKAAPIARKKFYILALKVE